MKKLMQTLLYPALAIAVLFFVHSALAEVPVGNKPLVVIRFNQAHVYYEQQLYQAISQAVATKPAVMLDVVSYAPATGNPQNDAAWQQVASRNAQSVVASLKNMGVPMSRMSISGQSEAGLHYDEVHVFVR